MWTCPERSQIEFGGTVDVREMLGAESETEAIDQALSFLQLREELVAGVARIAGTGGVTNYFENDREP